MESCDGMGLGGACGQPCASRGQPPAAPLGQAALGVSASVSGCGLRASGRAGADVLATGSARPKVLVDAAHSAFALHTVRAITLGGARARARGDHLGYA